MKHLFIIGLVLVTNLGFSQNELNSTIETESKYDMHDLGMSVTVNSAEELKEALTPETIIEFAEMALQDEKITIELVCNYKNLKENQTFFKSYKIVGRTGNIDGLSLLIDKTKKAAINDYNKFNKK